MADLVLGLPASKPHQVPHRDDMRKKGPSNETSGLRPATPHASRCGGNSSPDLPWGFTILVVAARSPTWWLPGASGHLHLGLLDIARSLLQIVQSTAERRQQDEAAKHRFPISFGPFIYCPFCCPKLSHSVQLFLLLDGHFPGACPPLTEVSLGPCTCQSKGHLIRKMQLQWPHRPGALAHIRRRGIRGNGAWQRRRRGLSSWSLAALKRTGAATPGRWLE